MTVNKTTTKTKKKNTVSNSTSSTSVASTSSTTKSSKTSKVVGSSSTTKTLSQDAGNLSKTSSASSLQIADISHLPIDANIVSYTVTETLPAGGGEKITTYSDSGATSTEYRHFIAQDSTSKHSSNAAISQISSTLNRSMSNISQESGSTYTVTEPREELKLTYNMNDSGWNGKFVYEQPVKRNQTVAQDHGKVVEHSSTSSSQEKKSSFAKSSSSSYVIEIVDGKERIVDQKHHETAASTSASNDEHLSTKSGTNIVPEIHYKQGTKESSTKYDTAIPELSQPQTKTSEATREIHQVGNLQSSSVQAVHGKTTDQKYDGIENKARTDTNWDGSFVLEKSDKTNKSTSRRSTTDSRNVVGQSETRTTGSVKKSGRKDVEGVTTTTTTTYYDSKGNVVKTVTGTDKQAAPGSSIVEESVTDAVDSKSVKNIYATSGDTAFTRTTDLTDSQKQRYDSVNRDSVRSTFTTRKDAVDTTDVSKFTSEKYEDNVVTGDAKYATYRADKTRGQNHSDLKNVHGQGVDSSTTSRANATYSTDSKDFYGRGVDSSTTTRIDANYSSDSKDFYGRGVDSSKIRKTDTTYSTDSKDFHGQGVDSSATTGTDTTYTSDSKDFYGRGVDSSKIRKTDTTYSTDSKDFHGQGVDSSATTGTDTTYTSDSKDFYGRGVDSSKISKTDKTFSSNSKDFYGHGIDSSRTTVKNVYDDRAIQNTIGTKGRVIKDNTIDTTDVIYSNDRNYGKTGWNGKFTYETPITPARNEPGEKRPQTSKKTGPDDKPSVRRTGPDSRGKFTENVQDFLSTEINENINQFTSDDATTVRDFSVVSSTVENVTPDRNQKPGGRQSDTPLNRNQRPGGRQPDTPLDRNQKPGDGKPDTPLDRKQRPGDRQPDTPLDRNQRPGGGKPGTPLDRNQRPGGGKPDTPLDRNQRPGGGKPDTPSDSYHRPGGRQPDTPQRPGDRQPDTPLDRNQRPGGRKLDGTNFSELTTNVSTNLKDFVDSQTVVESYELLKSEHSEVNVVKDFSSSTSKQITENYTTFDSGPVGKSVTQFPKFPDLNTTTETVISDSKSKFVTDSTLVDDRKTITDFYKDVTVKGPKEDDRTKPRRKDFPGLHPNRTPDDKPTRKPTTSTYVDVSDVTSTINIEDIREDFVDKKTIVENISAVEKKDFRDVSVKEVSDQVNKTFIEENIVDVKSDFRDVSVKEVSDRVNKTFIQENIVDVKSIVSIYDYLNFVFFF
jgi:hypothetical protein